MYNAAAWYRKKKNKISYVATYQETKVHCTDPYDNLHNGEETSDWSDDQVITGAQINTPMSSAGVGVIANDFQTQQGGHEREDHEDITLK